MSRALSALALLAMGCATVKARPPPPTTRLELSGARATWRPFTDASVCDAEPRFLLDELLSVNEVLKRFLRDTAGDESSEWPERQVALVEEGGRVLPLMMREHERNLALVERCSFASHAGYPVVLERGRKFINDVRERLDEAPRLIETVKRRRALETWHQQRLSTQDAARRTCPSARLGAAVVYFAWRDEAGVSSWLFCDGAAVSKAGDEAPRVELPPTELSRGKRVPEKTYLQAVARYPAESIFAPPPEVASRGAP